MKSNGVRQSADLLRASYFDAHSNVALLGGEVSTTSLTSSARFHRGTAHGWREREREREGETSPLSRLSLSLSLPISTLLQKPQCTKQLYSYEFTQPTRLHHHFFGSPLFPSARTSFLGAPLSIKRPTQHLSATLLGLERLSSACDLIL